MAQSRSNNQQLVRALNLYQGTALVIGSVIGSGIFVSTAGMARLLPTGWQLIAIWVFTGLLTIMGALTQAELAARMPVTGGLYAYFKEVFGERIAFFYGWSNFMIAGSGAMAAIAFIFASYLGEIIPLWQPPASWAKWTVYLPGLGTLNPGADFGIKIAAAVLIIFLTILNIRGVKLGAIVQSASSTAKITAMVLVAASAFFFSGGDLHGHLDSVRTVVSGSVGIAAIWFAAMGGAFWAYDGWGNVAYVGGELKDAQRNLPRAIILGTGIVIAVYLLMNLAYLRVLPMDALATAPGDRVASAVMGAVSGRAGMAIVAALIMLCTFDTVNSSILTNARVYFAMAREGLFFERAGRVSPRYGTPAWSLGMQCFWALVLLLTGSFDLITSMYVFVNWLFYLLIPIAVFMLRARDGRSSRTAPTFRVPLYPWMPLGFVAFTLAYTIGTLASDFEGYRAGTQPMIKSLVGLLMVLAGTPLLIWLQGRAKR